MKTMFKLNLGSLLFLPLAGCVVAQQFVLPAVPIKAEIRVLDTEQGPVEGAAVNITFPRYQIGDEPREPYQSVDARTDKMGIAVLSGTAQQDYVVSVAKSGYYSTQGPRRAVNSDTGLKKYGVGLQKIDLVLRPIRNPIVGISRDIDLRPLPKTDGPMGFDLEVGDWVSPFGKGRTADFVFTLDGRFTARRDYEQRFTLSFSRPLDGILSFRHSRQLGSALIWPYEAPATGYLPSQSWVLKWDPKRGGRGTTVDLSGETNYIYRVRSEVDGNGNLIRAMYGVVSGDFIPVAGNNEIGRNLSFTYALNPDWTRNLEFDPEKTASSPR